MKEDVTIYKAKKTYGLPVLFIIFLFLMPLFGSDTPLEGGRLVGLIILLSVSIILLIAPMAFKLEVGKGYSKTYFLGFCITTIKSVDVQIVQYSNLLRGGLGVGKGLNIVININGKTKNYSVGEKLYGKKAIDHVKHVLENKNEKKS